MSDWSKIRHDRAEKVADTGPTTYRPLSDPIFRPSYVLTRSLPGAAHHNTVPQNRDGLTRWDLTKRPLEFWQRQIDSIVLNIFAKTIDRLQ
jgi:hypothetical protein